MSKTITISLRAKQGKEEDLKKTLTQLITPCREEKGCLDYHIVQKTDDPRNFLAFMVYENEGAYQRHVDRPMIQDLRENLLPPLIDEGPDFKDWRDLG